MFIVMQVLHASTKAEILRLELDCFLNNILKSEKKFSINVFIEKHRRTIQFSKKVGNIYSGQLFLHFVFATLQVCFQGFIYLMVIFSIFIIQSFLSLVIVSL